MNEPSDNDDDKRPTRNAHIGVKNTFDIALQYIEKNLTSTPMHIFWIKQWRDIAVKSRISSAKQQIYKQLFFYRLSLIITVSTLCIKYIQYALFSLVITAFMQFIAMFLL